MQGDGDAGPSVLAWAPMWRERLKRETLGAEEIAAHLQAANPARIPRNHQVEHALNAAMNGDLAPFERLRGALAEPYIDDPRFDAETRPPRPEERVLATFCGT